MLKNGKSDGLDLFSEHLKHACPAIVNDLSLFFTACFHHGYLPKCIRDCVIVSVPKPGKDTSCSQNYRPITLASTLNKVLEHNYYSFTTSTRFSKQSFTVWL